MPSSSRASALILCWLVAHITAGAAIWFMSPGAETVWFHVGRWLTGIQDADSWKPIELARASAAAGTTAIYEEVFFRQGVKFQYPLTALTLVDGLGRPQLNVISWLATVVTATASAFLGRAALAERPLLPHESLAARRALDGLIVVAVLTSYPVVKAYSLGQIQTCVTALSALMLLAWQFRRPSLAGIALGAALLIKPACAPLLVWGAMRREWRLVAAALATSAAGLLVSLRQFPLTAQLDYVRVLQFIGRRGEIFYANQSINGALNRWVAVGGSLEWQPCTFAAPHAVVAFGTGVGFVLLIGAALWSVPHPARGSTLDLAAITLASTMASPVAWEHHYGILAPVVVASWPAVAAANPFGRLTGAWLMVSTLVAANYFQVANRFDGTWLNPLQSYLFVAASMLFVLLLRTARLQPA